MTLKPSQILTLLNAKREAFNNFSQASLEVLRQYREAWTAVLSWSEPELNQQLARHAGRIGARPLEPLSKSADGIVSFNMPWQNREQSLNWVRDRLTGITTFAVDGSQIYPSKDFSIPVALVQIGWFENPHLELGTYEKDVRLDVMTPTDLQASNSSEPVDRRVSMHRFQMETERLVEYMKAHPNSTDRLVFFDGSLVATFAEAFDAPSRAVYVDCLLQLLRTSETYRVPLVGYIDTSYAQDVSTLLRSLQPLPDVRSVHDAWLVNPSMDWGDRTPLFKCERSGILDEYDEQRDRITFTYLKTTREGFPARIEMPLWMYDAGMTNLVLDWVRGEVIIGSGYPYVIETADQTAVLQTSDRQLFYRILQDWADEQHLNLRVSRKMVSKARRR